LSTTPGASPSLRAAASGLLLPTTPGEWFWGFSVGSDAFYGLSYPATNPTQVRVLKLARGGGTSSTLATLPYAVSLTGGGIWRVHRGGGAAEAVAPDADVIDLFVDATDIYWTAASRGLVRRAR
jgi:hypothetical protein